jgi:hypothetical protein
MEKQGEISEFILKKSGRPELASDFRNLLAEFKKICDLQDEDALPELGLGAYNKETCFEFHQLLVATLLAYGKSLEELCDIKPSKAMPEFQKRLQQVWVCGLLLWRIVNSKMIRHHLYILHEGNWLQEPTNDRSTVGMYNAYTGFVENGCSDPSPGGEEEEDVKGQAAGRTWEERFGAWLRLQTTYWVALDLLSVYSGKQTTLQELKVSHIHLQHSGSLPVDPWRDVVIKLLDPDGPYPYRSSSTDPLQSGTVIALLEKEIEEATKRPECNAIFHQFKQPVEKFVCGSNIHCETALVALAYHVQTKTLTDKRFITDELEEIIRVRFHLCFNGVQQMTYCTECGLYPGRGVKAVLPSLLEAFAHPWRQT